MSSYLNPLLDKLHSATDPSKAEAMSAYMRNLFTFYGLQKPVRNQIYKGFLEEYGLPDKDLWKDAVNILWENEHRECQYIGMELANRCKKHWTESDYDFFISMAIRKSWWDTVDYIASNIFGVYFKKFPDQISIKTPALNSSDNMWLVRISILFQLKYKDETDADLLYEYILPHIKSDEFFIQKAIGWSLRQYAKYNPISVLEFVHSTDLKPLSKREALKHF